MNQAPTSTAALGTTVRLSAPVTSTTKRPIVQTIELLEGDTVIASATWFTHGTDGLIYLLDCHVEPPFQRRGVGTRLFKILHKEAAMFFRSRGERLRRIIAHTEQKTQIVARAWLTRQGFHHVQTIVNSLDDQDVLIYLLGCD